MGGIVFEFKGIEMIIFLFWRGRKERRKRYGRDIFMIFKVVIMDREGREGLLDLVGL